MLRNLIILPDGTELYSGAGQVNALKSVTLTECVNSGEELTIGSVCANMLEATLISPGGGLTIPAGTEVTLYQVDDDGTRAKVGLFTTEKPIRSSANSYKLTAYDRVSRLDRGLTDWLAGLDAWPYSLYSFAVMVCAQCGVELANESLPNGDFQVWKFAAEGITGRQLMSWIGEATAKFCRATPDGKLAFAWYREADTAIGQSSRYYFQGSLSYEDYQVQPIEKVQIQLSDNDIGVIWPNDTSNANAYKVTGNYLLATDTTERLLPIVQTIYNTLKDVTYTPGRVAIPANVALHAGDIVSVTDANGAQITLYIMTRRRTGQKDTLECTGSRRRDSVTHVNNQSYKALAGKVLNLQTSVEGLKVENRDTAGKVASLELEVDGIGAQVSRQSSEMGGIREQVSQLQQTSGEVRIQLQDILTNGVDQVTTRTGYTFNADGMRVQKQGEEIENLIDNTGMRVNRGEDVVLQADYRGVNAENITVRQFLHIGEHYRLEESEHRLRLFHTGGK